MSDEEGTNGLSGALGEVESGEHAIVDEGKRREIEGQVVIISSLRSAGTWWEVQVAVSLAVNEALGAEGHLEKCRNGRITEVQVQRSQAQREGSRCPKYRRSSQPRTLTGERRSRSLPQA